MGWERKEERDERGGEVRGGGGGAALVAGVGTTGRKKRSQRGVNVRVRCS